MVSSNTLRPPGVLAKMAATVDQIAHGRLDFGIGAGWYEPEHSAFGIPLYVPAERIRRLSVACELIRQLWTTTSVDFDGRNYQLKGARCVPRPVQQPYPPFVIGGGGEQLTLRVVAHYADMWNFEVRPHETLADGPVKRFHQKNARLREHCIAVGRDDAAIERSVQIYADLNTVDGTRAMLEAFIAAGVTHILLALRPPYAPDMLRRLVEEIILPVRSVSGGKQGDSGHSVP